MSEPTLKLDRAPLPQATPVMAFGPIMLDIPSRQATMEARVSVPATGENLPVLLLSHGHGASNFLSSVRGYGPLVEFYAAHGFVAIQVTHQDSKTLALDPKGPEGALFWRSRAEDFHAILDRLDKIEAVVPGLAGRVDKGRIAIVGHSMGGHTSALLAGATVTDIHTGERVDLSEPRIKAFIVVAPLGDGKDAAPWLAENYPEVLKTDYSTMARPALVIVGDKDINPNFSIRASWRADVYNQSAGPKTLLTVVGAEHIFGGISGWDAKETSDEDPACVAEFQRATWAYLRSALYPADDAWNVVVTELAESEAPFARVNTK